jgi:uncharacterized membrane protein
MISGIIIIVAAFALAVLSFFASNRAVPGQHGFMGLSGLGLAMLVISILALVCGIWKEVETAKEGEEAKELLRRSSEDLKVIRASSPW